MPPAPWWRRSKSNVGLILEDGNGPEGELTKTENTTLKKLRISEESVVCLDEACYSGKTIERKNPPFEFDYYDVKLPKLTEE